MAKTYCIEVGGTERPETVEVGRIEKGTGQTILVGETAKVMSKRADVAVPNVTQAWGVRLDSEGKTPAEPLDIKSSSYKGQIKELPWGDPKGCLIICRFLKGYNSIDMLYQDNVLNAKANINENDPSSADAYYIFMQSGDNFYDPETDKYLCQMLRIHYMNGSSKYRSPEAQQQMFVEVDVENRGQIGAVSYDIKTTALNIVKEAAEDNTFSKLKNLYNIVGILGDEEPKDKDLYRYLGFLADTKSDKFLAQVEMRKKEISDVFEKAKSMKVLDLTKYGVIAAGTDKKDIMGEGIEGKGNAMIDWVMENYLDPKSVDTIIKLKKITDKLN